MNIPRWSLSLGMTLLVLSAMAHPLEHWNPRNGPSYSQTLNGIAYGNGKFVAVGSSLTPTGATSIGVVLVRTNGIAVSSTNGIDWEARQLNVKQRVNAVVFANGRFVAVGNSGTILWSEDGNSWSNVSLPIAHNISAIGFGNPTNAPDGLFVAFATLRQSGLLADRTIGLTSVDGISWQTNRLDLLMLGGSGSDIAITSIAFGQGRFFAAWSLPGPYQALVSENGSNWTRSLIPTPNGIAAFGYDKFIVISGFVIGPPPTVFSLTSTNGYNWPSGVPSGSFYTPRGLCFGGGRFVAGGDAGYTATSQDGTNWTVEISSVSLKSVTFGDGIYASVGTLRQVFTSTDGSSWIQRSATPTPNQHLLAVASSSNQCVAAGWAGTIAWSPTGEFWCSANSPTTNNLRAVLCKQDRYIFAGDFGAVVSGDHFTNLAIRTSGTDKTLNGIAADAVTHVIVGDAGTVLTSEDTVDWTARNSTVANRLTAVTHGNGAFVAVGDGGTIVTSGDGKQWTKRISGTSKSFRDVAFGNGMFVAICASAGGVGESHVFISSNGNDWVSVDNSQPGESVIAFGNGFFVYPTYEDPSGLLTRFCVSTDGRTWELRNFSQPLPGVPLVNDLTYFGGAFISVANNGTVWQSDPVFKVTWNANSGSGNLVGPVSGAYRVQVANELGSPGDWMDLTNLTSFPYMFSDPEANNHSFRFYRARFVE